MEWSNEAILHFIEVYKRKDVIWNTKNINHFNKSIKNDAWDEISLEIGCSTEECKKKMTSLLSSFRREKSKISKSRLTAKSPEDVYEPSWFAYKSLLFLYEKDSPPKKPPALEDKNFQLPNTSTSIG